jgi:hypothetical protein
LVIGESQSLHYNLQINKLEINYMNTHLTSNLEAAVLDINFSKKAPSNALRKSIKVGSSPSFPEPKSSL